jgi:cyclopropane fatty-acyl-phospholipid synthase-like methyltransferase
VGHHVLDIGSGWGSLAIQVVKQTGCKYTGVTLSEEQLKYAEKKVKEAGLEVSSMLLLLYAIHLQFNCLLVINYHSTICVH